MYRWGNICIDNTYIWSYDSSILIYCSNSRIDKFLCYGKSKSNSLSKLIDSSIDTYDFTINIKQRTPAVTRIDRSVSLQQSNIHIVSLHLQFSIFRTHNTKRDGILKFSKDISYSKSKLTYRNILSKRNKLCLTCMSRERSRGVINTQNC